MFPLIAAGLLSLASWSPDQPPRQSGPSPEREAVPADARDPAEFEVYYHHTVTNRTRAELNRVLIYLPVPASDGYQQVSEFRVETRGEPYPVQNRTDAFGNKIRRVEIPSLAPGKEAHVGFSCVVTLSPPARIDLDASKACSLDDLPADLRATFTRDHPIFGLQTPIIKDTAARLLAAHPHPVARCLAIHDLIAGTFKYAGGDGWDRAPEVLGRRSGSCSEFAYVFCALARATGIPTRFVGASIFPARSKLPFNDHGHHCWAEAYLPGYGWVPFDPTLDRGRPPRRGFAGSHHGRTLIVTRIGDKSVQLGLSYVGSNSLTGETTRRRWFTWSQGTRHHLADADALAAQGRTGEARRAFEKLVAAWPGTRAAAEAAVRLAMPP